MMKRIWMIVLALLICATSGIAEGERKGGRDSGSMNLLNEGIACMNGDGVEQDYDAAMQRFLAADEAGRITQEVKKTDPKAFINVLRGSSVQGRFYIRPRD